ncbi:helix-turn-helix domain-containing protein [Nocardia cyriacigeorgica]|jgi:transcriptional regulator with XRE-family HTH domain|uniref:helix-turn-helix domain-containing protein n=3 Tax=Nocardia cyriacigeorgica TaxID=135487 RepID=UPI00030F45AC|nr:helix-turn-helix transcriptional regulator [Nocardia cyriacigeorgica]AVH24593.1 XRE family transcriptional regulator [Nocardia cyriacigeorgica]MBF6323400.1 helix-turn-helix transcriptional regulator [Nocardia cyriacigeorgica]MBF6498746.1 helix-turn-helix transcriptional regulator [Nocardia cyriacigeorgica]PPJ01918.1 XRE family transcriptional regulator [Nocardia cyriacigeorgica]TLF57745.1 helix-turn-helix transcriptional regulator [Nocardia cyriacigeorgica]
MGDELGNRLRSIRKRRGLTQTELAERSGVSVALIRALEQGTQERTRTETARRLATALRVETSALIVTPDAEAPAASDVELWAEVRRALEGSYAADDSPEPPTVAGVAATFAEAKPVFRHGKLSQLAPILVPLLRDADYLVSAADSGDTTARSLRSRIRQMVGWTMVLSWQFDAADTALRLALDDAPDVRAAVPLMDAECWRYIRQGDLAKARETAARWADDLEPRRISRASRDELAGWGLMLQRVSTTAVRDNRPGEAEDALTFAKMAATGIRYGEHDSKDGLLHSFGPLTVAMLEAENAMVADRPDITLALGERLENVSYPLPWVWNRHRLDVAAAHAATGNPADAVRVLQQIRRDLPEWLVKQRYARDIMSTMIDKRRTLTPDMRELADFVGVPY